MRLRNSPSVSQKIKIGGVVISYSVSGTAITLTRGDTFKAQIDITNSIGEPYIPIEGDVIRFAVKSAYTDTEPCIMKEIPIDTLRLVLEPEDTKHLEFGTYVYDIQITQSTGEIDTFIKGKLKITEEVD